MTLYISSISYQTTHEGLRELVSRHGRVESVRLVRGPCDPRGMRGTAFVDVADSDAEYVIRQLNGYVHDGRRLKVSEARPPRHQSAGAGLKVGVRA